MEKRVRAWHEHCNRRMKQWAILHQEFCHDLNLCESVFCAIAVMTQICIQKGDDKTYRCWYVRVCDQMLYPVLNGRYARIGTEVLCIGTDIDVLMDHNGVMRT